MNCQTCKCNEFKEAPELQFNQDINGIENEIEVANTPENYTQLQTQFAQKIWALWKGHTTRKQLIIYRKSTEHNHPYFSFTEIKETLRKRARWRTARESKGSLKYSSGSVYRGDWLGGFRQGYGTITYPNGENYVGNWSFGVPYGHGKFTHIDGESFEGEWKKYYLSPSELFTSFSRLESRKATVNDGYSNF